MSQPKKKKTITSQGLSTQIIFQINNEYTIKMQRKHLLYIIAGEIA